MKKIQIVLGVLLCSVLFWIFQMHAHAADQSGGFSLQVTPSPLISTIEPGQQKSLEVRVRNGNTVPERLKMELRTFSIDKTTGQISIGDNVPEDVKNFVTFKDDVFDVDAGQWYTQQVQVDTPKDAGFSYSFVILISREKPAIKTEGASSIEGSVALFTLLNTDRPDAVKKLSLTSFVSAKKVYEYLPTNFQLTVENTGNTIAQPKGNILIGRSGDEAKPLAAIEINPGGGYVIPASSRVLTTGWNDGFPSQNEQQKRQWDWSKLTKFRIGKYTAKAVLIYDDGQRDIPIESTVTFWVIPWKILSILAVIIILLLVGFYTTLRRSVGLVNLRKKGTAEKDE